MIKSNNKFSILLFCSSLVFFMLFLLTNYFNTTVFLQINLATFCTTQFELAYVLDWVSMSFLSLVFLISGCVFMFGDVYMKEDVFQFRFFTILLTFVISMCLLIVSSSFLTMLMGWDGLGITSFALIIYYSSFESKQAGFKTLLINRVGDVLIMLSVFSFLQNGTYMLSVMSTTCLFLLLLASLTKSAQYPFSSWLPAAMAAPTPVSALVHSSTLVTAGIYLMIRIMIISDFSEFTSSILVFLGAVTSILGGSAAVFENDLKKIIALSTLSQLGVMMFTVGMGYPLLALFHLYMHALFKAMLFMAAGNILMISFGCQDLRLLGGVGMLSPLTSVIINVSGLSLMGIPFLSAYYSKHSVMEKMFTSSINMVSLWLMAIATVFTFIYTLRMLYCISWSKSGLVIGSVNTSKKIYLPMIILGLCSVLLGKYYCSFDFSNMEPSVVPMYGLLYINLSLFMALCLFIYIFKAGKKNNWLFGSLFYLSPLYYKSPHLLFMLHKNLGYLDNGWLDMGSKINLIISKRSHMIIKYFKWPS
nr:NADH dehydrogenase subunit 5 [Physella acuta]